MADESTTPTEPTTANPGSGAAPDTSTADPTEAPPAVPVAKLREVEFRLEQIQAERAALAERIAEFEAEREAQIAAQAEAERKAAEEQGRFRELYESNEQTLAQLRDELDKKSAALTTYEEREQARLATKREANAERFAKLPETIQQLAVPGLAEDPDAMEVWLSKAETMPAATPPVGGGERNSSPRQPATKLTDEQKSVAKTYGFDPSSDNDRRIFLDTIWPRLGKSSRPAAEA